MLGAVLLTKFITMKSKEEIEKQVEKLRKQIEKDTLFLEQAKGFEITIENRIAGHREIEIRFAQERMLKWVLSDW